MGVFRWVGLLIGELRMVELVGLGEELPGIWKPLELCPDVLVNLLEFVKVLREFQAVV